MAETGLRMMFFKDGRYRMINPQTLYVTQGSGNCFKPALVAHQLRLRCTLSYLDVLAGETRQPLYLGINPRGVVPYLAFPDGRGLHESNAIAWYLAEGSVLMPNTRLSRAQAVSWMNFEQTTLEANISPIRFFTHIAPELAGDSVEMFTLWRDRGNAGLSVLDSHLQTQDFITQYGYSVADIAVFGYTHLANEGGFNLADFPAISAWIERVENQADYLAIDSLLDGAGRDEGIRAA